MKKLSFYEQVGIVVPGALFLFGLGFFITDLNSVFIKNGVTIGGLGIFIIISYAVGHLIAAFGNLVEILYWRAKGGMPSNWIVGPHPRLLSTSQINKIEALTNKRLGISVSAFSQLTPKEWFPIFRQIYSDVEKHGKPKRADTFNGNYGLNRGLCAASIALALAILFQSPSNWAVSAALLGVSFVYLYRMHRFGVHYAREIYNQFLLLPPDSSFVKRTATKPAPS